MTQHNFGKEDTGDADVIITYLVSSQYIYGTVFTCPEDGVADSITSALKGGSISTKFKCAIYKHSDLSLVGQTQERTIKLTTSYVWYVFTFADPKPDLVAGTDYVLVVWAKYYGNLVVKTSVLSTGGANRIHNQNLAYDGFPDPLVPAHDSATSSIYCTYTVAGGVSIPVMMHHYTQMRKIHGG